MILQIFTLLHTNGAMYMGKVNLREEDMQNAEYAAKLLAIGPGFGVQIWNLPQSIFICCSNYIKNRKKD